MTTDFLVRPIGAAALDELRRCDDAGQVREVVTDAEGGAPLRCCLRRSGVGERIMLVSYAPLRRWGRETGVDPGAYDECGPVFIHAEDCGGPEAGDEPYPMGLHGPRRVLRAYDAQGRILRGALVEVPADRMTADVEVLVKEAFVGPDVAVVHVRAVEFGCFMAEIRRREV